MFWKKAISVTLLFVILLAPAVQARVTSVTDNTVTTPPISASDEEYEIFQLINRERSRSRLSALRWDNGVAELARSYSRKMANEGFFDHVDRDGNSVIQRADRSNVKGWQKIGENLFVCEPINRFSDIAVRGWMKSPAHRRNVLDREWTTTGIGVARARDGSIYVTQVFIER